MEGCIMSIKKLINNRKFRYGFYATLVFITALSLWFGNFEINFLTSENGHVIMVLTKLFLTVVLFIVCGCYTSIALGNDITDRREEHR